MSAIWGFRRAGKAMISGSDCSSAPKVLNSEFLRAVDARPNSIERTPLAYPIVHKAIRRALLRKFSYSIFFVYEQDEADERIVV